MKKLKSADFIKSKSMFIFEECNRHNYSETNTINSLINLHK